MNLRDAEFEIAKLKNKLDKLLKDKESLEIIVDPKISDYSKIVVKKTGNSDSVEEVYILTKELPKYKNLDLQIENIKQRIFNYLAWRDEELKILKKYNKTEQLIVYYKEITPEKYSWQQIANKVHYSKDHCRKIYYNYKNKRKIQNNHL